MGKPYKQSLKEVSTTLAIAKTYSSQAIEELSPLTLESSESSYKKILKEPIGPVFLLSPYNYPLISLVSSLVPAVLSGNPVIIKPSPYTPLSAVRFTKAFESAGSSGLVQDTLLHTKDISKILQLPSISYVHLVGHSETGRTLYREIAHKSFIDIGLFLSSNNGVYVAEDANLGKSASQIIKSAMDNSGQSSFRYSRVFVHKSRYEEFLSLAEPLVMSYSIGDPMDDMTTLGPITEPDTIDTLVKSLEDAVGSGGQVLCGGNAVNDENGRGRFFEPTIVTGVDDSFPIMVRIM
jgi:acyl-CoA reductase-like NAD-dependent aldehyde dehydrogenase